MISHDESQYTILLELIVRTWNNLDEVAPITEANINTARGKLFDYEYGLSAANRQVFETTFLYHYLYREISETPIERWKMKVRQYLLLKGSTWETLLNSTKLDIDWQNPYNIKETGKRTDKGTYSNNTELDGSTFGTTEGTTTSSTSGKELGSKFPQATLNAKDYGAQSTQQESSGSGTDNTTTSGTNQQTSNASGSNSSTSDNTVTRVGNDGKDYSQLLLSYRSTVRNVLEEMLADMEYLFYSIY